MLLTTALPATAQSPDRALYKIEKEGTVQQFARERNGKPALFITVKFKVVRAADGQTATDVDKDEIVVTEDGQRVTELDISQPRSRDPVTVVLVLDTSGSMSAPADNNLALAQLGGLCAHGWLGPLPTLPLLDPRLKEPSKIVALHQAAAQFIRRMPAEAHMTLLPFSNTVSTPRSFTSDKFELGRRIDALPTPNGETALFDATLTAVETLEAARPKGRRAVVVLTDGIDNTSRRRVEEVIDRARETRTTLHLVGLGQPGDLDEKTMREMAEKTGGKYYPARNAADLQLHFRDVAEELGATYTVTFPSRRPIHDGTSRGIDISVVRGGKAVSARASYDYQVHGVVVAQMHPGVYLGLLALLGVLLALPVGMRRLYRFYGGA